MVRSEDFAANIELQGQVVFDFFFTAAREEGDDFFWRQREGFVNVGIQPFDKWVADIRDWEKGVGEDLFFKGEDGKEKIEIFCHERNSLFPPGPNRWADEVDALSFISLFFRCFCRRKLKPG